MTGPLGGISRVVPTTPRELKKSQLSLLPRLFAERQQLAQEIQNLQEAEEKLSVQIMDVLSEIETEQDLPQGAFARDEYGINFETGIVVPRVNGQPE